MSFGKPLTFRKTSARKAVCWLPDSDGGDVSLRKVRPFQNYTASEPRIPHSSKMFM
jgi:hypothetical protein